MCMAMFFFSSRRRHTRCGRDWSSDVCSSDLAWLARLEPRRAALVGGLLVLAGSVRAAMRVPVWHDDLLVVLSILEDSPASYRGPQYAAMSLQARRLPEKALEDYLIAFQIFDRDSRVLIGAADAAWTLRRSAL